ncbi:MAG: mechanosensitive ion channel family protein [Thiotrichales bacterium]|nr:mechanosensitive ion channel family protein [Thiotrichales bacterium]
MQAFFVSVWQSVQSLWQLNSVWVDLGLILLASLLFLLGALLTLSALAKHRFVAARHPVSHFVLRALRYPISVSVLLFALSKVLALTPLSSQTLALIHDLFRTLDVLVWGQFFFRSSKFYLRRFSALNAKGSILSPQTLPLLENVSAVLIVLLMVYLVFITWNIDMTAWLASAGIIGIAVGFAAKDTIANLLSGVFILADSPYKIGDYIVLDAGERGMVTQIGLRSTRILTRDDKEINIPNAIIANGKIINESAGRDTRTRLGIPVGVAYGSDIDQVKRVLLEVAQQNLDVCQEPEPRVRFLAFGASSLDLMVYVWIEQPEIRGRVIDSMNTELYKRLNLEAIEIPYSKHDLYLKSWPEPLPKTEETL